MERPQQSVEPSSAPWDAQSRCNARRADAHRSVRGLPGPLRRHFRAQHLPNRYFCQSRIVRGRAISSAFCQPSATFEYSTQKSRSPSVNRGRFMFRCNIASCWCNAMFSRAKSRLPRNQQIMNFAIMFDQNPMAKEYIIHFHKCNAINVRDFSGPTGGHYANRTTFVY